MHIVQDVLPSRYPTLPARCFTLKEVDTLLSAIRHTGATYLGTSLQVSAEGHVEAVAFATTNEAFYVALQGSARGESATHASKHAPKAKSSSAAPSSRGTTNLMTAITSELGISLAGFSMARFALHIHRDKRWHVNGVDLSSLLVSTSERPHYPSDFIYKRFDPNVNRRPIDALWYPSDPDDDDEAKGKVCLRAWISALCADAVKIDMESAVHIDTDRGGLRIDHLVRLESMMLCAELLENQKPVRLENEFTAVMSDSDGLVLQNARYKTRVRKSNQTSIEIHTDGGKRMVGQAVSAQGKTTKIQLTQGQYRNDITRVVVHGREELTCAENARDEFVLRLLQGKTTMSNRTLIDLIWFPPETPTPVERSRQTPPTNAFSKLNDSQREVAAAMISDSQPIVIAHGPPGTGKTSTIAAAVDYWNSEGEPAWVIAQSNVGVKNIARSFVDKGITDFKILVSKEFYVEWHEHLYQDIVDNLIRTDDLSQTRTTYETERFVLGSKIVLCTLSTLSNPVLEQCQMLKVVPMEKLIVDEASQINVFDYMHLFHKFKNLEKACFFGDPKQLPPFGQDAVSQLKSIFNVKHLKPTSYFLNTQYRMPIPLGDFISQEVYNSKLKSQHTIQDPSCVAFIHVGQGAEASAGKSWTNIEEARVVARLVRDYYRHKNYCIITPYDAQRATIVKALEAESLPSDKVFNVDSFQGHEADYVIVSPTRTTRPGFLAVQSRTNVMLTRCKAGMIIVSNSFFASSCAEWTLLGRLVKHWEELRPSDSIWIDWRRISEASVNLPGLLAPRPQLKTSPSAHISSIPRSSVSQSATRLPSSQSASQRPANRATPTPTASSSGSSVHSIEQQMYRLQMGSWSNARFHRADDPHFPEIPNLNPSAKPPALQGQWKRGSKAAK